MVEKQEFGTLNPYVFGFNEKKQKLLEKYILFV